MGVLINSGYVNYVGTSNEIKNSFDLTHKGFKIFEKEFNSESQSVVGLGSITSTILLDNHFFVTGEELEYVYGSGSPVGIATTVITGITTDKLPNKVYAVKVNENRIRLSSTPEKALKFKPEFLELTSLGIGTQHYFRSKKQNSKSLITIDNVIQSPLVSTGLTTILLEDINSLSIKFLIQDSILFSSGDVIKINDEILKIDTVGVGKTNIIMVERGFVGSIPKNHSIGSTITKLAGNYNIVNNTLYFTEAPYGNYPKEDENYHNEYDYQGISTSSTFSGRIFLRTAETDSEIETYTHNYVFDSISKDLVGLSTTYTLKVDGSDVTNFSENNSTLLIRSVFQTPRRISPKQIVGDYYLVEEFGKTKVIFTGEKNTSNYDINLSNIPLGGIIVSVGSTEGSGYQPLISAGGTSIISDSGNIHSISIGNSGSGYRSGIQTNVNVGVSTNTLHNSSYNIVGVASIVNGYVNSIIITNPGIGYTTSEPPIVIVDSPVGYENIPLIYSSSSQIGIGTGATIDLVVGQNGKIIDFELKNSGYGYKVGDILTVEVGGLSGIPTNTSSSFKEFQIYVDQVYQDDFSSWVFGELEVLDPFDEYFNGLRKSFPIRKDGLLKSIRSRKGSNIDVESTLLVFINNVLQVPGESYNFNGGSVITFMEAPKGENPDYPGSGDKSKILFYRGTKDVDVIDKDILETIENGDIVKINSDNLRFDQDDRSVYEIISSDKILTSPYAGPGIGPENLLRPISWCKSKYDKFIDGKEVTKDRIYNESIINPVTNLIKSVGIGTTAEFFVENVKSFFDSKKEFAPNKIKNTIEIISQSESKSEKVENVFYEGDFGIISGIETSSIGIGTKCLIFSLSIPENSILNDIDIVDPPIAISGLSTNYYFVVKNSNVGNGLTSLDNSGSILSIGSSFIDNVYQVYSTKIESNLIISNLTIFTTLIYPSPTIINDNIIVTVSDGGTMIISEYVPLKVTTLIQDYNELDSEILNYQGTYFGDYSWGRITANKRKNPKEFVVYENGVPGINTSPILRRFNPLKYLNYLP